MNNSTETNEQLLNNLGTTLKQLYHNPGMFMLMLINAGSRGPDNILIHAIPEPKLIVTLPHASPRSQNTRIGLGDIVVFLTLPGSPPNSDTINQQTTTSTASPHIGPVVGCLRVPSREGSIADGDIRLLVVDHGRNPQSWNSDTLLELKPTIPVRVCIVSPSELVGVVASAGSVLDDATEDGEQSITSTVEVNGSRNVAAKGTSAQQSKLSEPKNRNDREAGFIGINQHNQIVSCAWDVDGVKVVSQDDKSVHSNEQGDEYESNNNWIAVAYCPHLSQVALLSHDARLSTFEITTDTPQLISSCSLDYSILSTEYTRNRVVKLSYGEEEHGDQIETEISTSNSSCLFALVEQQNLTDGITTCFVCLVDTGACSLIPLLKIQPQALAIGFAILPRDCVDQFVDCDQVDQDPVVVTSCPTFMLQIDGKGLFIANQYVFQEFEIQTRDRYFKSQIQDVCFNQNGQLLVTTYRSLTLLEPNKKPKKIKYLGEEVHSLTLLHDFETTYYMIVKCIEEATKVATSKNESVENDGNDFSLLERLNHDDETQYNNTETNDSFPAQGLSKRGKTGNGILSRVTGFGRRSKRKPNIDDDKASDANDTSEHDPTEIQHYLSPEFENLLDQVLLGTEHQSQESSYSAPRNSSPPTMSNSTTMIQSPNTRIEEAASNVAPLYARRGVRVGALPPDAQSTAASFTSYRNNISLPGASTLARANSNNTGGTWSSLKELLSSVGLSEYFKNFEAEDMTDLSLLRILSKDRGFKETLVELGVNKLGHRMRIIHALGGV